MGKREPAIGFLLALTLIGSVVALAVIGGGTTITGSVPSLPTLSGAIVGPGIVLPGPPAPTQAQLQGVAPAPATLFVATAVDVGLSDPLPRADEEPAEELPPPGEPPVEVPPPIVEDAGGNPPIVEPIPVAGPPVAPPVIDGETAGDNNEPDPLPGDTDGDPDLECPADGDDEPDVVPEVPLPGDPVTLPEDLPPSGDDQEEDTTEPEETWVGGDTAMVEHSDWSG